jgi:hypothetical protein
MPGGDRIQRLLEVAGATYAQQAGIRLADRPAPLYQSFSRRC